MVGSKAEGSDSGPLSIVLLCSSVLSPHIGGLVSKLAAKGHDVEVVRGAELDSEKALSSVRRYGRSALYVFCRDDELDDYGVDHLKGVLRHSGLLEDRHLVAITPRERSLASDASALSTKSKLLGRSVPASSRPKATPPAPRTRAVAASTEASEEKTLRVPHSDTHPIVAPGAVLEDENLEVEVDMDAITVIGGRKKKGIAAAVSGLALAGAAALFVQCGTADAAGESVASADEAGPSAEAIVAQTQATLEQEAQDKAEAEAQAEAQTEAEKQAAEEAYRAEREAAAGAPVEDAKAEAMDAAQADEEAQAEEEPEEIVEETPSQQEAIDKALNERKLRALDMLVIDPRRSRRGNFKKAWDHCNERDAYGVTEWRLPTVGEITTLVSTGMVTKDRYWTITDANTAGTRRLLYDGKRKRIRSYSPSYRGARGVCVRKRNPDSE